MPDWLLPSAPGKFTWRMLAMVLAAEAVVLFFGALVARALAATGAGAGAAAGAPASTVLWGGTGLAVLALVAAALVRRGRAGIALGWLVQAAALASSLVVGMMLLVGTVFLALWVWCLRSGHRIDSGEVGRTGGSAASVG